jgi:hypothetical protein
MTYSVNDGDVRFAPLPVWQRISGMSRSGVYRALSEGHLKGIKLGKRLLVDVDYGLAWLRSLPPANIRAKKSAV